MPDLKFTLVSNKEPFTRDELEDALEDLTTWNNALGNRVFNNGHSHHSDEADAVVRKIIENRQKNGTPKEEFTFTETELRAAYKRLGWASPTHGSAVIASIKAHREPDYPVGTVVTDADGEWWKRWHDRKWLPFGDYVLRGNDVPKRPLTVKS